MQARINADELASRCWNRTLSLFIRRGCRAGQPKVISIGIDDEPLRLEISKKDRQVRRSREPREPVQTGGYSVRRNKTRVAKPRVGLIAGRKRRDGRAIMRPCRNEFARFHDV